MTCYLSFCDELRPKGSQFLGGAIVPGDDLISAVKMAHVLGCNPGGEVVGHPIPEDIDARIPDEYRARLLTRAEIDTLATLLTKALS